MEKIASNFQSYLDPDVSPASDDVARSIANSPLNSRHFLSIETAAQLAEPGYSEAENGHGFHADGSVTVSVLTDMPQLLPVMWHWWFGWHGDCSEKYKLWYPQAHISAEWKDKMVGTIGQDPCRICPNLGAA